MPVAEVVLDFGLLRLAVSVAHGFLFGQGGCEYTGGELLVYSYWLQFSFNFLTSTIWAVEQPDPSQSCRILEPLPAHGARRAPGQKPTHS